MSDVKVVEGVLEFRDTTPEDDDYDEEQIFIVPETGNAINLTALLDDYEFQIVKITIEPIGNRIPDELYREKENKTEE